MPHLNCLDIHSAPYSVIKLINRWTVFTHQHSLKWCIQEKPDSFTSTLAYSIIQEGKVKGNVIKLKLMFLNMLNEKPFGQKLLISYGFFYPTWPKLTFYFLSVAPMSFAILHIRSMASRASSLLLLVLVILAQMQYSLHLNVMTHVFFSFHIMFFNCKKVQIKHVESNKHKPRKELGLFPKVCHQLHTSSRVVIMCRGPANVAQTHTEIHDTDFWSFFINTPMWA